MGRGEAWKLGRVRLGLAGVKGGEQNMAQSQHDAIVQYAGGCGGGALGMGWIGESTRKIGRIAKRYLSKDIKTFIEADILDEELELTSQGKEILMADYFLNNQARIIKIAKEIIKEREEED